ncbi:phosphoribosylaminoimidazolesuccinocarboxamide synthase [Pseudomonas sp. HK3]
MSLADSVLTLNNHLPIRTDKPVHSGKVRSVYWLTEADSKRLIVEKGYNVASDAPLAIMVISDRLSAFECIWHAEGGLNGIPGKGAALNAISNHWFKLFKKEGLAESHILDTPHPFLWVVQKAKPVMIEAICRNYITGSMWRAYEKGEREFCGITLSEGLKKDQKLSKLLMTPSTKGILTGIPGVPEQDDVNVSRDDIFNNFQAFALRQEQDIDLYEKLSIEGFNLISGALADIGQVFVDTKFEFGYVSDAQGQDKLIYMDEVGTPDSSRIWDATAYCDGKVVENSKEAFRQLLLNRFFEPDILLNKDRMAERKVLARDHVLPVEVFQQVSDTYISIAEKITGQKLNLSANPKAEIIQVLKEEYQLID